MSDEKRTEAECEHFWRVVECDGDRDRAEARLLARALAHILDDFDAHTPPEAPGTMERGENRCAHGRDVMDACEICGRTPVTNAP